MGVINFADKAGDFSELHFSKSVCKITELKSRTEHESQGLTLVHDQNFSGGGSGGDTFKTPSPYEQLLPLPTPCFKMFLERSLNDPPPPHFKHLSLLPPPHLPPIPPPLKILIIHLPDNQRHQAIREHHIAGQSQRKSTHSNPN